SAPAPTSPADTSPRRASRSCSGCHTGTSSSSSPGGSDEWGFRNGDFGLQDGEDIPEGNDEGIPEGNADLGGGAGAAAGGVRRRDARAGRRPVRARHDGPA